MAEWLWVVLGLLVLFTAVGGITGKLLGLLMRVVFRLGIGILLLLVGNYIGGITSFSLPINLASIAIAGILGVPGLLLLVYLCLTF